MSIVLIKEIVNRAGVNLENSLIGENTKYLMHHCVIAMINKFSIRMSFKKAMTGFLSTF
jgi:hypothetical protein